MVSYHPIFSANFQVAISMSRNVAVISRQLIHMQSIVHALAEEEAVVVVYAFAKKIGLRQVKSRARLLHSDNYSFL